MTLHYILRASLCRMPHCYSSHVQGKGYVGKPVGSATGPYDVEDPTYGAQYKRAAESEIENMNYAPDYAEPGYDTPEKGILFANWNVLPNKATELLERYGYAIEWSDEWCMCESCGEAVRTSPDSFWFRLRAGEWKGEMLCLDCFQEAAEEWRAKLEESEVTE